MKSLARQPLLRLLAVNFAAGCGVALLMLAGLLALNPAGLRDLILADGATALVLLGFGLFITFGSAAMCSAIMLLGRERPRDTPRGKAEPAPARVRTH
jgi:hypothetical protein